MSIKILEKPIISHPLESQKLDFLDLTIYI
jgi:hypothetical protein